jgi:hypothetical protein
MKKGRGRFVIYLLGAGLLIAALSAYWAPRYFEAAWFLEDIAAGPAATGTAWKKLHKAPVETAVTWTVEGRAGSGDLYMPAERVKGRMLFIPGLVADGRRDPRVIAFAQSLARAGFVTLVPQTAAFDGLKASPADITTVSDAAMYLSASDIAGVKDTKVAIAALSYMSGPSILAAARPPLNTRISFVFFIGPYYAMTDMVRFVTTRKYRLHDNDPWREAAPAPYATWAFLKANAEGIDDAEDRRIITDIAEWKLRDDTTDVSGMAAMLRADGKALYALITNRDPDLVAQLITALPPRLRAGLDALDPSKQDLSGFQGEAILIHGRDDPLIASVESEKLAVALGSRAHLYVLEQVTHVEMNRPASMWDQLNMLFAGRRLLSYRD